MKNKTARNPAIISSALENEMIAFVRSISTPEYPYTIKDRNWEWLPKTNPGIDIVRAVYTLESRRETREERRIVKHFLEGDYESKRFGTPQEGAQFESSLLCEYQKDLEDRGKESRLVPHLYTRAGNHWEHGIVIMEDLGIKGFRERFFELLEQGRNEAEMYQLFSEGLAALDKIHSIGKGNERIGQIVSKAPFLDYERKMRISYRLLAHPEQDAQRPVDGEKEFLANTEVIPKYMRRGGGKGQPILGDVKPDHLFEAWIDFGRSRFGHVEFDKAGFLFSDLPLPVEQAIEIYKQYYPLDQQSRNIVRLIASGVFEGFATAGYVNALKALHKQEYDNLCERSPRFVTISLYQERVWRLMEEFEGHVTESDKSNVGKANYALNKAFVGSALEINGGRSPMDRPHGMLHARKIYSQG